MVRQHHRLDGHEFEKTPGDSEGQGSAVCCSLCGHKVSDTTQQLKSKMVLETKLAVIFDSGQGEVVSNRKHNCKYKEGWEGQNVTSRK